MLSVCNIILPSNIFISSEGERSLINITNSKYTSIIIDYLNINTNRNNESMFSLEDIILYCNLKLNKNKGKSNDTIKNLIVNLINLKVITNINLNTKNISNLQKCILNIFKTDSCGNVYNYIQVTDYERNKIFNYDKQKIDKTMLFNLYCHLKARMYKRKNNYSLSITGGKAQVCYPSYKSIENDILIKPSTIKKYIDILSDIDLIRYDNAGTYIKDGNKYKSSNTYVLYDENGEWKYELEQGIKFFKKLKESNGYKFI